MFLKDSLAKRSEWPLGLVTQVFPSGKVCKIEVIVSRKDDTKSLLGPLSETVLLLPHET